jgi:hypothetical protein
VSWEAILNVIVPAFRDIRTELKRLGYTARDIASIVDLTVKSHHRIVDSEAGVGSTDCNG